MPDVDIALCVALVMCSIVALTFVIDNWFLRREVQDWKEDAGMWRDDAQRLFRLVSPMAEDEYEHIPEETLL